MIGGSVRVMPVVVMGPEGQRGSALSGVLIEAGVEPLADGGLDEAFGLAVGARRIDAGVHMAEIESTTGVAEPIGVKTGAIVGHDAAGADAKRANQSTA